MEPQKDMKTVRDFHTSTELKIFRGQCLNNAVILVANGQVMSKNINNLSVNEEVTHRIYRKAKALFKEGIKQDFLNWKPEE